MQIWLRGAKEGEEH
jgi:hypothetical protein